MAGIGRPRGQRGHNPVRMNAMKQFSQWRTAGHAAVIDAETAYEISGGEHV